MRLDLVIGETGQIESSDKDKLQDIASRVKDLNARLHDIRREQVFQRVSFLPVCFSSSCLSSNFVQFEPWLLFVFFFVLLFGWDQI